MIVVVKYVSKDYKKLTHIFNSPKADIAKMQNDAVLYNNLVKHLKERYIISIVKKGE